MRNYRLFAAAVVAAGTLTASVAATAGNQPGPLDRLSPQVGQLQLPDLTFNPLQCGMGSGDVQARVLIRNGGTVAIAPYTQLSWRTNGGATGMVSTGAAGLAPGASIQAGYAAYPFTCTARVQ